MIDQGKHIARTAEINGKVAQVLQTRLRLAQEHFIERCRKAVSEHTPRLAAWPLSPWAAWTAGWNYALDWTQRMLLFWDTMRKRGNVFMEHERAGVPPVLHFKYETVLAARKVERPVNYTLVRILPPAGVSIDPKRRTRLRNFLDRLLVDPRLADFKPTRKQLALLKRIREIVGQPAPAPLVSTRRGAKPKTAAVQGRRKTISTVSPLPEAVVDGVMKN